MYQILCKEVHNKTTQHLKFNEAKTASTCGVYKFNSYYNLL
jgi:hypothetical protein